MNHSWFNAFYVLILVSTIGCKSRVYVEEHKVTFNEIGVPLDATSIEEVEEKFGMKYEKFNWNTYSTEHIYRKKGISFTYKQEDSIRKSVNWINVETAKNLIDIEGKITINKRTTVEEFIEQFENSSWDYDSTYSGLVIVYESFDIIVKLNKKDIEKLNKEPLSDDYEATYELFKKHKIKGVEIY